MHTSPSESPQNFGTPSPLESLSKMSTAPLGNLVRNGYPPEWEIPVGPSVRTGRKCPWATRGAELSVTVDWRHFLANLGHEMHSVTQKTPCNDRLVQYLIENCPPLLQFTMTVNCFLIAPWVISEVSKVKCQISLWYFSGKVPVKKCIPPSQSHRKILVPPLQLRIDFTVMTWMNVGFTLLLHT